LPSAPSPIPSLRHARWSNSPAFEPVQEGRIYIEKFSGPSIFELKGTPAEHKAGLDLGLAKGRLEIHESGTYVEFTASGPVLFA
jgi:hypothetical protein